MLLIRNHSQVPNIDHFVYDFSNTHKKANPKSDHMILMDVCLALLLFLHSYRMDRIKARQQKYKKGKERMLSLTQESGEGQDIQKLSEEDDESMSRHFPLIQVP